MLDNNSNRHSLTEVKFLSLVVTPIIISTALALWHFNILRKMSFCKVSARFLPFTSPKPSVVKQRLMSSQRMSVLWQGFESIPYGSHWLIH